MSIASTLCKQTYGIALYHLRISVRSYSEGKFRIIQHCLKPHLTLSVWSFWTHYDNFLDKFRIFTVDSVMIYNSLNLLGGSSKTRGGSESQHLGTVIHLIAAHLSMLIQVWMFELQQQCSEAMLVYVHRNIERIAVEAGQLLKLWLEMSFPKPFFFCVRA